MAPLHVYYKGVLALDEEFEPDDAFQLEEARLHLGAVGGSSEDFLITLDSLEGSEFDVVLNTQAMAAVSDEVYQPTRPEVFRKGEKLKFTWTNTSAVSWGLEIVYQLI